MWFNPFGPGHFLARSTARRITSQKVNLLCLLAIAIMTWGWQTYNPFFIVMDGCLAVYLHGFSKFKCVQICWDLKKAPVLWSMIPAWKTQCLKNPRASNWAQKCWRPNKLPKVVVLFLREKVECYVQQEKKIAYHEGKVPLDVPIMVKPGCWRENLGESKGNVISFTPPLWLSFTDNPDVPA